eukprot:4915392-Pyramimonas_sp.AAC.1
MRPAAAVCPTGEPLASRSTSAATSGGSSRPARAGCSSLSSSSDTSATHHSARTACSRAASTCTPATSDRVTLQSRCVS